ncbi:hypothetical protein Tco_0174170 [Tanacetum coccineum]
MNIVVNASVNENMNVSVNVYDSVKMCHKCFELETELIKRHNKIEQDEYDTLSKSYSKLEQPCISHEIAMQLNKEIFQKENTYVNTTEPTFDQLFEVNNLKAQLKTKENTIKKLKAHIKRVSKPSTSECVNGVTLVDSMGSEITEVQTVFNQMEQSVEQYRLDTKSFEIQKKQVCIQND